VSALLDPQHPNHVNVREAVNGLQDGAPIYVSCVTLAEIHFGALLHEAASGQKHPRTLAILRDMKRYPVRQITRHTAEEYAEIKKALAVKFLPNFIKSHRPRWVEDWTDRATAKKLQVDENDLWIYAQAREWNFAIVTTDCDMVKHLTTAGAGLKFVPVKSA
jgi:predicted nucleic acid-binding protein